VEWDPHERGKGRDGKGGERRGGEGKNRAIGGKKGRGRDTNRSPPLPLTSTSVEQCPNFGPA